MSDTKPSGERHPTVQERIALVEDRLWVVEKVLLELENEVRSLARKMEKLQVSAPAPPVRREFEEAKG